MSMSCLKNDTVLTWQKLHRRKVKSLQSGCGHLPAELIFSPASPRAKLKRQYSSRLQLSLWHLKNLFPSPPELAACDDTRASWRRVAAALPPSPRHIFLPVPGTSKQSALILQRWWRGGKRKEQIPGVGGQGDGERPTDALIHGFICIKTAACSLTYLFGGEFYQGSLIALKEGKKKCQKSEMRHFLPKERRLRSWTRMKGCQDSCRNQGLRGAAAQATVSLRTVALIVSQQRRPPPSAHDRPSHFGNTPSPGRWISGQITARQTVNNQRMQ